MKPLKYLIVISLIIVTAASNRFAFDDAISGAAKVKLSGTLTQEQMAKCKLDARGAIQLPF